MGGVGTTAAITAVITIFWQQAVRIQSQVLLVYVNCSWTRFVASRIPSWAGITKVLRPSLDLGGRELALMLGRPLFER